MGTAWSWSWQLWGLTPAATRATVGNRPTVTKGIASHDFGHTSGANASELGANRLWLSWHIPCGKRCVPNMPSPSDQGGRPVTPCPKCQAADVEAVALSGNFVYLGCMACAYLFAIEDRRSGVRPEHQSRIFS